MRSTILRQSAVPAVWNSQPMQQNMQGEEQTPEEKAAADQAAADEAAKAGDKGDGKTPDQTKLLADLEKGKQASEKQIAKLTSDLADQPKKIRDEIMGEFAKALGLGPKEEITVESLQKTLKEKDDALSAKDKEIADRDAKLAERDRRDAIRDAISTHKGRPSTLHAIIGSGELDDLDQTSKTFKNDVAEKVKAYIEANPEFSIVPQKGSDGGDFQGGAGDKDLGDDDDIAALIEKKSKNSSRR